MMAKIKQGFQYLFHATRPQRDDGAQRAAFLQYQTYPANSVQGGGTLVKNSGRVGSFFDATQTPQVFTNHRPVTSSLIAGGTYAGGIAFQPLVDKKQGDAIG